MKNLESISLRVIDDELFILDQQKIPHEELWVKVENPQMMIDIIYKLKVRGAPLIGVSATLCLALWRSSAPSFETWLNMAERLKSARPTAVNLMNNIDSLITFAKDHSEDYEKIHQFAANIFEEDVDLCEKMALAGQTRIANNDGILTHCNTGGLATVGLGTALGVIKKAAKNGKNFHVYVDETRPLLQGGRLTAWELCKEGISHQIICDNMAGALMSQGKIQSVFVGADRIALNGDFANKIGTYSLAVLAKYHGIPFYAVAPRTTIDFECKTGEGIPVEQRNAIEVKGVSGSFGEVSWAPKESDVLNPAFDVTPFSLVTALLIDGQWVENSKGRIVNLKDILSEPDLGLKTH